MLDEGAELAALDAAQPLSCSVLAVGAGGGDFTRATLSRVTQGTVRGVQLDGVGHYPAMEAPDQLAAALLAFYRSLDTA